MSNTYTPPTIDEYLRKRMAAKENPIDKIRAWVRGFTRASPAHARRHTSQLQFH